MQEMFSSENFPLVALIASDFFSQFHTAADDNLSFGEETIIVSNKKRVRGYNETVPKDDRHG